MNGIFQLCCAMNLMAITVSASGRMLRQTTGSEEFEKWAEEVRSQRPCFQLSGNFPFIANENAPAASTAAAERCSQSKVPSPPPAQNYTGWEAYWMQLLGRPEPFPAGFPWPMRSEDAPLLATQSSAGGIMTPANSSAVQVHASSMPGGATGLSITAP
eukprot:jgi/Botrbrau1/2210/Bobra.101_2s0040.1